MWITSPHHLKPPNISSQSHKQECVVESANDPVHTIAVNKTSYVFCLFVCLLMCCSGRRSRTCLFSFFLFMLIEKAWYKEGTYVKSNRCSVADHNAGRKILLKWCQLVSKMPREDTLNRQCFLELDIFCSARKSMKCQSRCNCCQFSQLESNLGK